MEYTIASTVKRNTHGEIIGKKPTHDVLGKEGRTHRDTLQKLIN